MEQEEIEEIFNVGHSISRTPPQIVEVQGKRYKVPHLLQKTLSKIENLRFDIELMPDKRQKKKKKMLDTLYAKITAYILLNGWSIIPFVHAIKWRMVYNSMTSEEMNAIMEAGINNKELAFFLKNCRLINSLLALKMNQIKTEKEDKQKVGLVFHLTMIRLNTYTGIITFGLGLDIGIQILSINNL